MPRAETWPELEARGFRELLDRRPKAAARAWIDAARHFGNDKEIGRPCFSLVQNNAGAGYGFLGELSLANEAFLLAQHSWEAVIARVGSEPIEAPGRSSSHHLRLAFTHDEAFASAMRRRAQLVAEAGLAITAANAGPARDVSRVHRAIAAGLGERSLQSTLSAAHDREMHGLEFDASLRELAVLAADLLAHAPPLSFWQRLDRAAELSLFIHCLNLKTRETFE